MNEFIRNCPKCNDVLKYTSKGSLERAKKLNSICNKCNQYKNKKFFNVAEINDILKNYEVGKSFTEISQIYKVNKRVIKRILFENNVFIEKRKINENEFLIIKDFYLNHQYSCIKISEILNLSKELIKKTLKIFGILRNGFSNGRKINLSVDDQNKIKSLYLYEYKNTKEISEILGLSKAFVSSFLNKSGFRRDRSTGTSIGNVKKNRNISYEGYLKLLPEYSKYKNMVTKVTRRQPIESLSNYEKRGLAGVEGAYHLDHKYSILEGFKNDISPEIIGNINNLEFLPWIENTRKNANCSISISQLNY
jgi:hypothetical protein